MKEEEIGMRILLSLWDAFTSPFYMICNFFGNVFENFKRRCQCFRRGYSQMDVWDIDWWFVRTVKSMLKDFKSVHWGHPTGVTDDEWESILEEMIDHLELMDEENVIKSLGLTRKNLSYEESQKIGNIMIKNKECFFKLFSKWFYSLWD